MKQFDTVLFDIDGTLLDSNWVWSEIDRMCERKFGIKYDKNYSEQISYMDIKRAAKFTIERYKIKIKQEELRELWIDMAKDYYTNKITLKSGVKKFLEVLKERDIKMGVVSSGNKDLCIEALKRNDIMGYFGALKFVQDIDEDKQSAKIYKECLKELASNPLNSVVFEDIIRPLEVVKREGIAFYGVYDKSQSKEEREKLKRLSDCYIEDFNEFVKKSEMEFFRRSVI